MQSSISEETKPLCTRPEWFKDLLFSGAPLRISGKATRESQPVSPHPFSYAPSLPPFHTVVAQDRDTFLPACHTLLLGWSHAEYTHYSSCCPQGASPGNRIWASESMLLEWLFVSHSLETDEFHWCMNPLQLCLFCVCWANLYWKKKEKKLAPFSTSTEPWTRTAGETSQLIAGTENCLSLGCQIHKNLSSLVSAWQCVSRKLYQESCSREMLLLLLLLYTYES